MPAQTTIVMERNVAATMRDGCVLYADVYRPADDLRHPVLLQRIPYGKGFLPFASYCLDPLVAAHAGYVVVIQDVRGRFESEGGPFYLYRDEFADGFDTVEWVAAQPYSDGNVGMFGASYMGMTQWQAAVMRPPHLKAIFPCTSASGAYFHRGGAVEWGLLANWTMTSIGPAALLRALPRQPEVLPELLKLAGDLENIERVFETLPLSDLAPSFAPWMRDILEHEEFDDFHRTLSVREEQHRDVEVPAFVFAGWYDCLIESDLQHFSFTRSMAATETARTGTRLMVGPWAHAGFWQAVGERNFGPAASGLFLKLQTDLTSLQLRWFDRWLRGIKNGIEDQPPVELFVMGHNRWRYEHEWPLARTKYTPWYLLPERGLGPEPAAGSHTATFVYDPRTPAPTRGGNHLLPLHYPRGPVDQRSVEAREDVLTYTSAVLERDLEVTGPVVVKLWAGSSAPSTDFTAKLVDVFPDGRAFNVCDGIRRVKDAAQEAREHTIDLWATSNVFLSGHRVRVEISSSNFPRFDRNLNTGLSGRDSQEIAVARQSVFCGAERGSCVLLPVIEQ